MASEIPKIQAGHPRFRPAWRCNLCGSIKRIRIIAGNLADNKQTPLPMSHQHGQAQPLNSAVFSLLECRYFDFTALQIS